MIIIGGLTLNVPYYLVADAYYVSSKTARALLKNNNHLVSRCRSNAVAYFPAPARRKKKRGRKKKYGRKIKLISLFKIHSAMTAAYSPVYDEEHVLIHYRSIDLLWSPLAVALPDVVWKNYGSWMRTMNLDASPSEQVVAVAMKNTFPEFLLDLSAFENIKKFIIERIDAVRCPILKQAA